MSHREAVFVGENGKYTTTAFFFFFFFWVKLQYQSDLAIQIQDSRAYGRGEFKVVSFFYLDLDFLG